MTLCMRHQTASGKTFSKFVFRSDLFHLYREVTHEYQTRTHSFGFGLEYLGKIAVASQRSLQIPNVAGYKTFLRFFLF